MISQSTESSTQQQRHACGFRVCVCAPCFCYDRFGCPRTKKQKIWTHTRHSHKTRNVHVQQWNFTRFRSQAHTNIREIETKIQFKNCSIREWRPVKSHMIIIRWIHVYNCNNYFRFCWLLPVDVVRNSCSTSIIRIEPNASSNNNYI